ncbi:MAG: Lon-like protease helical domain-containing protein, partial [Wenzhouxiangella sp.]
PCHSSHASGASSGTVDAVSMQARHAARGLQPLRAWFHGPRQTHRNDFDAPHGPRGLRLPPGMGQALRRDMQQ